MSRVYYGNSTGRSSVEEFASGETNARSRRARARERRRNRLWQKDRLKKRVRTGGDMSSLDSFKFLECEPITIDEPVSEAECPFCTPDPTAYVPDYISMFPGETFYDGKTCTYCIALEVAAPNMGGPTPSQLNSNESIINEIKKRGIKKLLEYYNKSEIATVYYYVEEDTQEKSLAANIGAAASILAFGAGFLVPNEEPGYTLVAEQRNVIDELLEYTTFSYTIPVQPKARTKIRVNIDSEVFYRAPANAISEPSTEFETDYEVSMSGQEFKDFSKSVWKAMGSYDNRYVRWMNLDGGRLSKVGGDQVVFFSLNEESEYLEMFYHHIDTMLHDAGFKNIRKLENITFKFEPIGGGSGDNQKIRLKQLIINKFGCPEVIFDEEEALTKGIFYKLVRQDGMDRTSTLYYVGSLPEMYADVTATEPLPWLDFVIKYTYPALKVDYGAESDTLFNDPDSLSCALESMLTGDGAVESLISSMLGDLIAVPDLFLEQLGKELCMTPEEFQKELEKKEYKKFLDDDFKKEYKKLMSSQRASITKGDKYMEQAYDIIAKEMGWSEREPVAVPPKIPKPEKSAKYKARAADDKLGRTWQALMDNMTYCGWISLIMKALDCVAQGMGEEDFKSAMAEAALGGMDDAVFQKLLVGLPPEAQAKLAAEISDDWKDLPAPWDTQAYQVGSYPGGEFTKEMLYTESQKMDDPDYAAARDAWASEYDAFVEYTIWSDKEGNPVPEPSDELKELTNELNKVNSEKFPGTIVSGVQDTSGGILGLGYDGEDFSFGEQSKGSGGTYATALGDTQKAVFDAYKNQALKSIGVDDLMNEIGKLPYTGIAQSFLKSLPCKPTPPWAFDPRIDSFLNTIEFDFCHIGDDGWISCTLPKRDKGETGWNNIMKSMMKSAWKSIKELVIKVIMAAIKALFDWLLNLACDLLALLGASLGDLLSGSDKFGDMLANALCPDQDPETVNEALGDLFSSFGGEDASCLSELTGAEMGAFIDDLSVMLTQDQICALLKGNADSNTLTLAAEVARASDSLCIREVFSNRSSIASLFSSLGRLMPIDDICAQVALGSGGSMPAAVAACPPDMLAKIDEVRCELLSAKGLSPEECRDELSKLKDAMKQAALDLADLGVNGPMAKMPPMTSDGCVEGIYAKNNPVMEQVSDAVSGMILSPIESGMVKDLLGGVSRISGKGGFLNAVLSDTNGRPWDSHNFAVKYFGAPLANQLGWFQWASDDAIKDHEDDGKSPDSTDIYGVELDPANMFDSSTGGFPPTVASWLALQYRNFNPTFKTVVIPEGYSSTQEAIEDYEYKTEINERKIASRKEYLEQYIKENHLDDADSKSGELELAAILRKTAKSGNLFVIGSKGEEPEGMTEEEEMTRTALSSADDPGGYGVHIRELSEWGQAAIAYAGTNGRFWSDWATDNLGGAALVNVPDISTSDVKMDYIGYEEEAPMAFRVGYDYNLLGDDDTILKGGDYIIKILRIEPDSPSGGGSSTRAERRSAKRDGNPPDAILEEDGTEYTIVDLKVESEISPKIQKVLDELPLPASVDDSWQIETFYRLIGEEIFKKSGDQDEARKLFEQDMVREYFAGDKAGSSRKFDDISSGFFKRIANRIAIGRSYPEPATSIEGSEADDFLTPDVPEEESEPLSAAATILDYMAPSFKFGYDPNKEPEILYLDNETYGGPLAQLFPDSFPPPFYVQPPEYTGWMDLVDALLPSPESCEPTSNLFFDLSDIKGMPNEVANQLTDDPRMSYDPLCSQEAPYDKIYPNHTHGSLEMAMRAAARVYISSNFMQMIPIISQFAINDDNYDEGLFDYITDRMRLGLMDDGRAWNNRASNEYYYRFLEQAVNVIARKVQSGVLDPDKDFTEEEKLAFETISNRVLGFYEENDGELAALSTTAITQQNFIRRGLSNQAADSIAGLGAGSAAFSKSAAEAAKKGAFELMVSETEAEALVFVKRLVKEEYLKMGEAFNDRLLPPIQNIDHLFLLSDSWIRGGLQPSGPLHVISDPTDPSKYNIPSGMPESLASAQNDLFGLGLQDFATSLLFAFSDISVNEWPFVLQKYIRIQEKDSPFPMGRAENLYDVVNIENWDAFVAQASNSNSGKISDYWGEYELNSVTTNVEAHEHSYSIDKQGNGTAREACEEDGTCHTHEVINFEIQPASEGGHIHDVDLPAWKFGLRICYMPEKDTKGLFDGTISTVSNDTVMREKAYRVESLEGTRHLIPIASAELNIPDQDFSLFDPESYDVYCLIAEIIKTPEYQTWFRYVFPLQRFTTIMSIYNRTCFLDAIGNTGAPSTGGDMWETQGGNWWRDFRHWDRGSIFDKSRSAARDAFESLYTTTQGDFEMPDEKNPASPKSFVDILKPLINFEDGLRWWQRGRRVKNKPTDADGNNC